MLEIWPMWFKSKNIFYRKIIDIVDCKITYKKLLEASNWKPKINFNLCTESNTIKQYTYGLFLCSFFFTSTFIIVSFLFFFKMSCAVCLFWITKLLVFFLILHIFLSSPWKLLFGFSFWPTYHFQDANDPKPWFTSVSFFQQPKKNFALPVVYSSYSPFAWFVTNCIHSAVELGRLAMYSVVYYNIVSNVWSFPKVAPPCYQ